MFQWIDAFHEFTLTIPIQCTQKIAVIDVQNEPRFHFMIDIFQWARFRKGTFTSEYESKYDFQLSNQ